MKRLLTLLSILALTLPAAAEEPVAQARRDKMARVKLVRAFDAIDRDYVEKVDMSPLVDEAVRAMGGVVVRSEGSTRSNRRARRLLMRAFNGRNVGAADMSLLADKAVLAMVTRLDPHSRYVPAGEAEHEKIAMQGRYGGVGAESQWIRDTMTVVAAGSGPAARAGLRFGDRIVSENGRSVVGLPPGARAGVLPSGAPGSVLTLGIVRRGEPAPMEIAVTRELINKPSVVWAHHAETGVGYIRAEFFSESTAAEMREVWERQMGRVPKLIIDLRGNGGGNVGTAIEMAGYFLPKGAPIVSTEGRRGTMRDAHVKNRKEPVFPKDGRVAILIDGLSASASELFAGALQDAKRATVVGRRSFDKGLIQRWYWLGDGSRLSLTAGRYKTPSGRTIQRPYTIGGDRERYMRQASSGDVGWGIAPDAEVPGSGLDCGLDSLAVGERVHEYMEFVQEYLDAYYLPLLQSFPSPDSFVAEYGFPELWYEELTRRAARLGVGLAAADSPDGRRNMLRLKTIVAERLYGKMSLFLVTNAIDNDLHHAMAILNSAK